MNPIQCAVTVSLTPQARGGPFVFWDDLEAACRKASELGFDAIEIFPPDAQAIEIDRVRSVLDRYRLKLAAVGTGAGWVVHKLTLTSPQPDVRARAREFIRSLIDAAARLGAPAIIGSMQGRCGDGTTRDQAVAHLTDALNDLGEHAHQQGTLLLFEALNRYETNIANTLADGVTLLRPLRTRNVKLLADLFHMNIEEVDLPSSLRAAAGHIGHVHLADSNRRPAGAGHTDFAALARALHQIDYHGYLSAECFPHPDPDTAAMTTIEAYRRWFAS